MFQEVYKKNKKNHLNKKISKSFFKKKHYLTYPFMKMKKSST